MRFEDIARDLEQQGTGVRMNLAILARTAGHLFGGHARFPTFCLKLHGSLNWYWVPEDAAGYTLQRWLLPGTFGSPEYLDEEERDRGLPGAQPFIVPPAALKSDHLRNPVVRDIWRRASDALCVAKKVALLGYSLPPADRSFGEMVSEAVRGRDVDVDVVNPDPTPVVQQLLRLGVSKESVHVTRSILYQKMDRGSARCPGEKSGRPARF